MTQQKISKYVHWSLIDKPINYQARVEGKALRFATLTTAQA